MIAYTDERSNMHLPRLSAEAARSGQDKVDGDNATPCPLTDKQGMMSEVPSPEKKKKSRIRIGMGKE